MAQAYRGTAPARRVARSDMAKREERSALLLLLPSFLVLLAVAIYPLGEVFATSFTNRQFASPAPVEFVGFRNYRALLSMTIVGLPRLTDEDTGQPAVDSDGNPEFERPLRALPREPVRYRPLFDFGMFGNRYAVGATSPAFMAATWDTLVFTVLSVAIETILGLIIALTLSAKFLGRGLMRTAMLVPWSIITVVSARMWEWMFQSTRVGFFNTLGSSLGLTDGRTAFLQLSEWQLPVLIAVDVWKTTPFIALLLLAGLAGIPGELYEAAMVDGATRVRRFFAITLPLLRPILAVALIFRTLDALRVFDLFQVVYGRSRYSMASFGYDMLIGNRNAGLSSAVSVIIFVVIFVFAIIYIRLLGVKTGD